MTARLDSCSPISSTALVCAEMRAQYTDIPYVKEIYAFADTRANVDRLEHTLLAEASRTRESRLHLSILEGRYRALNHVLKNTNHVIVEIAAGLSPRGLELTSVPYIETDLPAMIDLKRKLVGELGKERPAYVLHPMNALDKNSFQEVDELVSSFGMPASVVQEGLAMYLSRPEQEQLRENVSSFMKRHPGSVWLTTDFSSRPLVSGSGCVPVMKKIEQSTGRTFNRFESDEEVYSFLESADLQVTIIGNPFIAKNLGCLERLGISAAEAASIASSYRVWRISAE